MSKPTPDPTTLLDCALEIYTQDTYILSFRQNMQAAFPALAAEDVEALYARCKEFGGFVWAVFKKALGREMPLAEAQAQIRAQEAALSEVNWQGLESVMARHLLKFSDEGSSDPAAWRTLANLGKAIPPIAPNIPKSAADNQQIKPKSAPSSTGTNHDSPLNQALAFAFEWSENWNKPIFERMRRVFPEMTQAESEALEKEANAIKSIAWQAYEEVYAETITGDEATRRLREQFAAISEKNLAALASQGMYYAWHG